MFYVTQGSVDAQEEQEKFCISTDVGCRNILS